jgi:hypothetical protein
MLPLHIWGLLSNFDHTGKFSNALLGHYSLRAAFYRTAKADSSDFAEVTSETTLVQRHGNVLHNCCNQAIALIEAF